MKLLFDHNLSHTLPTRLADVFPRSTQTRLVDLARATDAEVWFYARTHGFIIVTKDHDFAELAVLKGGPPAVVWLRIGNCSTSAVERLLRASVDAVSELATSGDRLVLELFD